MRKRANTEKVLMTKYDDIKNIGKILEMKLKLNKKKGVNKKEERKRGKTAKLDKEGGNKEELDVEKVDIKKIRIL